ALRHFLTTYGERVWGRYGFVDAFCEERDWYADTFLAIDQGPIVVMIENYRSQLLWKLFMSVPEVRTGLRTLGLSSPHLDAAECEAWRRRARPIALPRRRPRGTRSRPGSPANTTIRRRCCSRSSAGTAS